MSDSMSGSTSIPFASMFTDPLAMGLLGAAGAASQMAMPTRMPIPFGAALGATAAGFAGGGKAAAANQLAQTQAQSAQLQYEQQAALQPYLLAQNKALASGIAGMPGQGTSADGSTPLVSPQMATIMAERAALSGEPRGAQPWLDIMKNMMPSGGGYYIGQDGAVHTMPGANPAASGRTIATEAPKAAIDVNKAWQMLAPEAQKALIAAGIDVNKAWRLPQSMAPGNTVASPAQIQGTPAPDPFPAWASRINGGENPTGNPGATNPSSSATGNGQFLNATWPNVLRATRPDLTVGKTDASLLPLRDNPTLALSATEQYARQNGALLAQAGLPVNGSTIYMAHGLGPQGAISVLQKPDNTPVASFLPSGVISANPYLQNGATVGSVKQHFTQLMSGADAALTQPQGGTPTVVPASPSVTEADEEGKRLSGLRTSVLAQAKESANAHLRIQQAQAAITDATKNGIPPGYFSPELAQAAAAAKSLGINTSTLGVDPKAVSNTQAANEAMVQITGEILKRLFPQRITNMDIKLYGENLAHYGMDPGALQQVLTLADGAANYDTSKATSMLNYEASPHPGVAQGSLVGWEPQFYQKNGYGPQFWDMMQASQKGEGGTISNAPSSASTALPQAALGALKKGQITTFGNGQRWTLNDGGQPQRVQ